MSLWTIVEAWTDLAIAAILVWPLRSSVREVFTAVGRRYRFAVLTIVAIVLIGQALNQSAATYPLVAWDMHTVSATKDPEFVDYTVLLTSGREDHLLLGNLFPAASKKLRARIDESAYEVDRLSPDRRGQAAQDLDVMLAELADAYNSDHPGADRSAAPAYLKEPYGLMVLQSSPLSATIEVAFVIVTIFEILSLLCLGSKWFRRAWLVVILTFHILSWPLIQSLFLQNILLIPILLVDLDGIAARARGLWSRKVPGFRLGAQE